MVTFCVGVVTSPTPSVSGTADQLPSSDRSPSSDHKGLTGHPSKASSLCSNPSPASSSLSTPAVSSPSTPQAPPNTPILLNFLDTQLLSGKQNLKQPAGLLVF